MLINRIHSNNYNKQSVPKNTGFDKSSLSESGTVNRRERKKGI